MGILLQGIIIFVIILISISFIYFIPVENYYFSPLLISVIGAVSIGFLSYFEIKTFLKPTPSGLISIVLSVVFCIIFLQNYHNRLQTKLINYGKKDKMTIGNRA